MSEDERTVARIALQRATTPVERSMFAERRVSIRDTVMCCLRYPGVEPIVGEMCAADDGVTSALLCVMRDLLELPAGDVDGEPFLSLVMYVLRCALGTSEASARLVEGGAVDLVLIASLMPTARAEADLCLASLVRTCRRDWPLMTRAVAAVLDAGAVESEVPSAYAALGEMMLSAPAGRRALNITSGVALLDPEEGLAMYVTREREVFDIAVLSGARRGGRKASIRDMPRTDGWEVVDVPAAHRDAWVPCATRLRLRLANGREMVRSIPDELKSEPGATYAAMSALAGAAARMAGSNRPGCVAAAGRLVGIMAYDDEGLAFHAGMAFVTSGMLLAAADALWSNLAKRRTGRGRAERMTADLEDVYWWALASGSIYYGRAEAGGRVRMAARGTLRACSRLLIACAEGRVVPAAETKLDACDVVSFLMSIVICMIDAGDAAELAPADGSEHKLVGVMCATHDAEGTGSVNGHKSVRALIAMIRNGMYVSPDNVFMLAEGLAASGTRVSRSLLRSLLFSGIQTSATFLSGIRERGQLDALRVWAQISAEVASHDAAGAVRLEHSEGAVFVTPAATGRRRTVLFQRCGVRFGMVYDSPESSDLFERIKMMQKGRCLASPPDPPAESVAVVVRCPAGRGRRGRRKPARGPSRKEEPGPEKEPGDRAEELAEECCICMEDLYGASGASGMLIPCAHRMCEGCLERRCYDSCPVCCQPVACRRVVGPDQTCRGAGGECAARGDFVCGGCTEVFVCEQCEPVYSLAGCPGCLAVSRFSKTYAI